MAKCFLLFIPREELLVPAARALAGLYRWNNSRFQQHHWCATALKPHRWCTAALEPHRWRATQVIFCFLRTIDITLLPCCHIILNHMILYYTIPIDTIHSYMYQMLKPSRSQFKRCITICWPASAPSPPSPCFYTPLPLSGENFRQGWTLSSSWIAKYFWCDFL